MALPPNPPLGYPGLSAAEVETQRQIHGPNAIVERVADPWRDLLGNTARDPMIWFLAATSGLYGALGQRTESLTLALSVIPLIAMDAVLHWRTQASTAGLKSRLTASAHVWRDGHLTTLPATALVPGDLVGIGAGESMPADGVVVSNDPLQVDESLLTGEALPVVKRACPVAAGPRLKVDDASAVWAGTRLLSGAGWIVVTTTGAATRYGAIVRLTQSGVRERTPLQQAIGRLVGWLTLGALLLCAVLFATELLRGQSWIAALVSAATLAIAALPEEFPVVFTVFLSVGVLRLARQQALVRRLVSVENIGRVTCIATDKTGTITT
ncbi:MAG: cation-transporting P-type ATPase, partial [bacterium]